MKISILAYIAAVSGLKLQSEVALEYKEKFGLKDDDLPSKETSIVSADDQDFWEAQNEMRQNPASFIPELEAMAGRYDGLKYAWPAKGIRIYTHEGAAPVHELIDFLKEAQKERDAGKTLPILAYRRGLSLSCEKHIKDTGAYGHEGGDGSSSKDRRALFGESAGLAGENLSFGVASKGRQALINLAVDDGVSDRGHRENIFDPVWEVVGVYSGKAAAYAGVHDDWVGTCAEYAKWFNDDTKKTGGATCGYRNGKCGGGDDGGDDGGDKNVCKNNTKKVKKVGTRYSKDLQGEKDFINNECGPTAWPFGCNRPDGQGLEMVKTKHSK